MSEDENTEEQTEEKKEGEELAEEETEDVAGGRGRSIGKRPKVSIRKIPNRIGPTGPGEKPGGSIMHSPDNST